MTAARPVLYSFPARENRASNPYTAILADALERLGWRVVAPRWKARLFGRAAIVHVHWPQKIVDGTAPKAIGSALLWLGFLRVQKARGARLVWTTHNIASHEAGNSGIEAWFMHAFTGMVDGIVSLSEHNLTEARAAFPALRNAAGVVIPHWTYGEHYPLPSLAPDMLAGPVRTVAFLGDIKRYKGLHTLFDALDGAEPDTVRYLIHGRCADPDYASEIDTRIAHLSARGWTIDRRATRLSDQEMVDALARTDLLLLPYESGENSGLAVLAAERGVPLFVSNVSAFSTLVEELGTGMATRFHGHFDHDTIVAALAAAPPRERRMVSERFMAGRSPDAGAEKTQLFYRQLRGERA